MIQMGNFSGANDVLEQMKTAIPQAEQSGDYQIVQGELLRKQGDFSGALQATYKAIETSDDNDLLARAYRLAASICEEIGENKISEEIELLEHGIERLPGGYYNALAGQLATSYIRQARGDWKFLVSGKGTANIPKDGRQWEYHIGSTIKHCNAAVSATGFHRCHGDASSIKDRLS